MARWDGGEHDCKNQENNGGQVHDLCNTTHDERHEEKKPFFLWGREG